MFAPPRRYAAPALVIALAIIAASVRADGPGDNLVEKVRPVPPVGIELPPADAAEIKTGLAELQADIKAIGKHDLLPDVEIYEKAVRWAVEYHEVFDAKGIPAVKSVLKAGLDRAKALKAGKTPWTTQTGLVVRGYRSRIDGSVQPYGLVVPKEYDFAAKNRHRLDFWWHGRGETLSEVNFIDGRSKSAGEFTPAGALVLHPYGRYCNANKFAGEEDTFECLGHAKRNYRIDDRRVVARGFSMGGAACWQFATHYPMRWAAAAPGAGFSETPEFLKVFQNEDVSAAPWYEQKLWHWYNATDYAANLSDLPTVAYSGADDKQKQAADAMQRAMVKEGLKLNHIIGPKTGHSYEKAAKAEVNSLIDAIVGKGRSAFPEKFRFVTYTMQYSAGPGFHLTGLGKHWEPATVVGGWEGARVTLDTKNITSMIVYFPPATKTGTIVIDGTELEVDTAKSGFAFFGPNSEEQYPTAILRRINGKWENKAGEVGELRKMEFRHGPVDHAFMQPFVMVTPSGKPMNEKVGAWAAGEMKHATEHWRKQFRGDAPVKKDTEITAADIENSNLVLWGDPSSNAVLAKVADKLPIKWTADGVTVGDKTYPAGTHVPVLIYPNPLNPFKYVVLNSGFTFREYDYLNNARQVPKLPDYAVLDITTPNARTPGKVVRAGFFGEKWELQPDDGK